MEALPSSFGLHGVEINAEVFELLLIYKFSQTACFSSDPLQVVQKGETSEHYCATSSEISDKLRFNEHSGIQARSSVNRLESA